MGDRRLSRNPIRNMLRTSLVWMAAGLVTLSACAPKPPPSPTPTLSLMPSLTATITSTPTVTDTATATPTSTETPTETPTVTNTFLPTVTPTFTATPTITLTPFPTETPTQTESPAPTRPAGLFTYHDAAGQLVNWSYAQMTNYTQDSHGKTKHLSAMLAFQLMDRGIHRETLQIMDRSVTVYYLNVQHDFGLGLRPMRLILGGMDGDNVPIGSIPAGGNAYIRIRMMSTRESLDPFGVRRDAALPYDLRIQHYPDVTLKDFQVVLSGLPDALIVLADQSILVDPDSWHQVQNDMATIAYLAARYSPFIQLDNYNRVVGSSLLAQSLEAYFLHAERPSALVAEYSSETLVIITRP